MATHLMNSLADSNQFASTPTRRAWSRWIGPCAVIAAMTAIYLFGYLSVRSSHRTSDGRLVIHTGSQIANRIFAPATSLEKLVRDRPIPDPEAELASILAESRTSEKPVLIVLGTKTCLPCRQLEQFLHGQRAIMSKNFVIMKANVDDELTPGELLRDRFRTSSGNYYPWIAFLNGNGELLVTSDDGPEGLIGIPHGGPGDRAWFLRMLRLANPVITDDEIARLDAGAKAYHDWIWRDVVRGNDHDD